MVCKTYNIYYLAFYGKSVLAPGVKQKQQQYIEEFVKYVQVKLVTTIIQRMRGRKWKFTILGI